jgi:ribosomal-protein-alanine N-acetyltransferase
VNGAIGQVALTTRRLLLRPLEGNDLGRWLSYTDETDELYRPFFPVPETLDPMLRFELALQKTLRGLEQGTAVRLMAFDASGEMVGQVGINNIVRGVLQSCDMGWAVRPRSQRQGIAAEMCRAAMEFCFEPAGAGGPVAGLGLHRVACAIMPRNVASLGLAAKLGFRQEGFARKLLQINGVWEDHVQFAKLTEEHRG